MAARIFYHPVSQPGMVKHYHPGAMPGVLMRSQGDNTGTSAEEFLRDLGKELEKSERRQQLTKDLLNRYLYDRAADNDFDKAVLAILNGDERSLPRFLDAIEDDGINRIASFRNCKFNGPILHLAIISETCSAEMFQQVLAKNPNPYITMDELDAMGCALVCAKTKAKDDSNPIREKLRLLLSYLETYPTAERKAGSLEPIHLAVATDNLEAIAVLLEHDSGLAFLRSCDGLSPLCYIQSAAAAELLCEHLFSRSINQKHAGYTALAKIIENETIPILDKQAIVRFLHSKGADLNSVTANTSIVKLAITKAPGLLKTIVELEPRIKGTDSEEFSRTYYTSLRNLDDYRAIKKIAAKPLTAKEKHRCFINALVAKDEEFALEVLKDMDKESLEERSEISATLGNMTEFHSTAMTSIDAAVFYPEVLTAIKDKCLDEGIEIDRKVLENTLNIALQYNQADSLETLQIMGLDLETCPNNSSRTPMQRAVNSNAVACIEKLASLTSNDLTQHRDGHNTLLHTACLRDGDTLDAVLNLRGMKSVIDERDGSNYTALMITAKRNNYRNTKALIEAGANKDLTCNKRDGENFVDLTAWDLLSENSKNNPGFQKLFGMSKKT